MLRLGAMNDDAAEQEDVKVKKEALDAAIAQLGTPKVPVVEAQTGSAVLIESTKIMLRWDAVPGAVQYKVVDEERGIEKLVLATVDIPEDPTSIEMIVSGTTAILENRHLELLIILKYML